MSEEDEQIPTDVWVMDALEGVMTLLQVLVVSLDRSGHLDSADYIQALLSARDELIDKDSIAETLVDRMLDMLVKEGAETLHRRRALHLVRPGVSPEPAPSEPAPGREPEGTGT